MLTRGRHTNHLYLQVVGDDPHTVIRPDTISPRTPTETLQHPLPAIRLRSPPAPCCASSTAQRPGFSRRSSLHRRSPGRSRTLVRTRDRRRARPSRPVPARAHERTRLADPPANLLGLAAETGEPTRHMLTAAAARDLSTAGDMAAILHWRLPALAPTNPGPLPWLPGIPRAACQTASQRGRADLVR